MADLIATSPLITCGRKTCLLFLSSSPSLTECVHVPFLVLLASPWSLLHISLLWCGSSYYTGVISQMGRLRPRESSNFPQVVRGVRFGSTSLRWTRPPNAPQKQAALEDEQWGCI